MSKKVLILSGSPRKNGNSDILCDEFMKGSKESGNVVEKIRVATKKLRPAWDAIIAAPTAENAFKKTIWQRFCRK